MPHAPDVSGDINRYVWDGRVQAEGINPYRYAPDDPVLARLRDGEVYPGINRKPVTTSTRRSPRRASSASTSPAPAAWRP